MVKKLSNAQEVNIFSNNNVNFYIILSHVFMNLSIKARNLCVCVCVSVRVCVCVSVPKISLRIRIRLT